MSDTVIKVEDISKLYRLGEVGTGTLSHDLNRWWHKVQGKEDPYLKIGQTNDRTIKGSSEYVWAIKDISFEVKRGAVLGIIGRNGAGKSTLLKILSRVTTPTSGAIKVKGRIASLLEVGTGFNPELTGRDNIYLNGSILGMRKREIDQKFDEIVAFARYSSGMYVRLAFAVAAHLEPEILIVDEVLAVGDAEFQKKCLGKIRDVSQQGRTVLFVSHNMNAVTALCSEAIVMRQGTVVYQGNIRGALACYGASSAVKGEIELTDKSKNAILKRVTISQNGEPTDGLLEPDAEVVFSFEVEAPQLLKKAMAGAAFVNSKGDRVFVVTTWMGPAVMPQIQGNKCIHLQFSMPPLVPGRYTIDIGFYEHEQKISEEHYSVGAVEVSETNYLQTVEPTIPEMGQLYVRSKFSVASV
jgi:lipopolysaccharide transport system ATP-binding protein